MPEHPGREAVRRDDHAGMGRRVLELRAADRSQRQVTQRAAPIPALEPRFGEDPLGTRDGFEVRERL
jgi:hypothetical protein